MSKQLRQPDLAEQMREAVRESGLNRFELSKRTGVRYAAVHGFMAGTRDIQLSTATAIARVLGLELRKVRKGR